MAAPEVLARYDFLLISCVPTAVTRFEKPFTAWLEAGGRAYVETWSAQTVYPLQSLVRTDSGAPQLGDVLLTLPGHPVAAGLDPAQPSDMHHLQGVCVLPRKPEAAEVFAHYCPDKGNQPLMDRPAMLSMPVGKGWLVFSGAPVAFARFHRGRSAEGLLLGVINALLSPSPPGFPPRLLYTEPANTAPPGAGPRLVLPEPARELTADADAGPAPPTVAAPDPGAPPAGLEFLDCLAPEPYDVLATIRPVGGATPTVLGLDALFSKAGNPARSCAWLGLTPQGVELGVGKTAPGKRIASAAWSLPADGAQFLVRRRPGRLSVLLGAKEVLQARVSAPLGGAVPARSGSVAFVEPPICQPVAPAVFGDDFMREPGSETPWIPLSGSWGNVGVGDEEYSVNGFYYLGKGAPPAHARAGDWFWEDYSLSVAVRPNAPGTLVELCALVQDGGDCVALSAQATAEGDPGRVRLIHRVGGEERVLAEQSGGLTPAQWYRLAVRVGEKTLGAFRDGELVFSAPNPEARPGGIGLRVQGGSCRFDDVVVRPAAEPIGAPHGEGSSQAELPSALGAHDMITWANPAMPWEANPQHPERLWHWGLFPGDVQWSLKVGGTSQASERRFILAPSSDAPETEWTIVSLAQGPETPRATLVLLHRGRRVAQRTLPLREATQLGLARVGGRLGVSWGGRPVLQLERAPGARLGLEVSGAPVQVRDLAVNSAGAHDYAFGAAPTDWLVTAGTWEVAARWACDDRWSWLAGWGPREAVIWNKRRFEGDIRLDAWMGVKMVAPGGDESQRCRDLNAVICGDGQDPRSGYSLIIGGDDRVKTQLLRNGQVVAEAPAMRVPAGYNVHHSWFRVRLGKIGNVVTADFERRPALRFEDPDPLPGGYAGLWTRNSGVLVPRVTIWN
jgi:hypothetical protein